MRPRIPIRASINAASASGTCYAARRRHKESKPEDWPASFAKADSSRERTEGEGAGRRERKRISTPVPPWRGVSITIWFVDRSFGLADTEQRRASEQASLDLDQTRKPVELPSRPIGFPSSFDRSISEPISRVGRITDAAISCRLALRS